MLKFCDNWFSSVPLMVCLTQHDILSLGPVRANQLGVHTLLSWKTRNLEDHRRMTSNKLLSEREKEDLPKKFHKLSRSYDHLPKCCENIGSRCKLQECSFKTYTFCYKCFNVVIKVTRFYVIPHWMIILTSWCVIYDYFLFSVNREWKI